MYWKGVLDESYCNSKIGYLYVSPQQGCKFCLSITLSLAWPQYQCIVWNSATQLRRALIMAWTGGGHGALLECPIYDIHFQVSLLISFIYWSSVVIYCLLSVSVAVCDSYDRVGAKDHIGRPMLTLSVIPWFIWKFWPLLRQVVQLCNIWPPGQKKPQKRQAQQRESYRDNLASHLSHLSTSSSHLTVIIGRNLLLSVFTFTYKSKILQSFISWHS